MVIPRQMQQSMQHQHLQLDPHAVSQRRCVLFSDLGGNSDVPRELISKLFRGRKRQYIGRFILLSETAVQIAHLPVRRDQHIHTTLQSYCLSRPRNEAC